MILEPSREDHNIVFLRLWYWPCDECDKPATGAYTIKDGYDGEVDDTRWCDEHGQNMMSNGYWLRQNIAFMPPWDWSQ